MCQGHTKEGETRVISLSQGRLLVEMSLKATHVYLVLS